jgi:hypothetical protein
VRVTREIMLEVIALILVQRGVCMQDMRGHADADLFPDRFICRSERARASATAGDSEAIGGSRSDRKTRRRSQARVPAAIVAKYSGAKRNDRQRSPMLCSCPQANA